LFIKLSNIFTGVTWILVYKTEKYQRLKTEIEKQSKKCINSFLSNFIKISYCSLISNQHLIHFFAVEKIKESHSDALDKQFKKKVDREEEKLKNNNRDLSLVKMKSMMAIGFAFTALLGMFNSM